MLFSLCKPYNVKRNGLNALMYSTFGWAIFVHFLIDKLFIWKNMYICIKINDQLI